MKNLKTSDFYYELPEDLIAQVPIAKRDASKMMVLDRKTETIEDKLFTDLLDYLNPGDAIVLNDTKVIPARLFCNRIGKDEAIEILLLEQKNEYWECLVRPGKKMKIGTKFEISNLIFGEVCDIKEDGNRIIKFQFDGIWEELLDELGEMPLPPYIHEKLNESQRYQTVYSKVSGSSAAPTAGLHFTKNYLEKLKQKGIKIIELTLHVGLGTFRPVKTENILEHKMHAEYYSLSEEAAKKINEVIKSNKRILAVGTTVTRTLESIYKKHGKIVADSAYTDIFIYPGFKFKVVDALLTNFHLPESTLLMLVSAFASKDFIFKAYNEAITKKYRFFSFGDCMLIK
ncbi:MAG: tRNA preQ1(34) S-adenosylmethionine ribosyltransferase-isomerase QueA [Tissierellia bacterium]|nr:tRNA preQ1(34) S-adenosylmethionine ribosyltransferase-isomerase QueA [Tissierellia bacterium]